MPWDMKQYPSAFKQLEAPIKKKAIEIGNAMLDDGYKEHDAIPIAISQAKSWYEDTPKKDIEQFYKHGQMKPSKNREKQSSPTLNERNQLVKERTDGWAVQAEGAQKPSHVYKTKKEAVQRAKEIAKNKGTDVKVQ
ncbi:MULTISPECIES: DUF2188 domain-containing protein [Shouchella]|uniref:DUF2188 domain-containing protein n=4 Tax=Bacillaceae TaxID=186817 RepID=A0A060LVI2_9BACI|nr:MULTISPECIES: DUF2188 domain-containing protein [Bacillaceae]AIC94232.1 hypothetical protein BleG1_1654 [Shouchella lehensis G1]KQL57854.1 hypothetical protein AN965_05905 [Alkalicoccobacillus plakortidis]MBG9785848.1 hypothetical protein [Shouchella lehensis]TES48314.1 DUF2188 domain-containing protein [Shouchella lehensis]